MSDIMTVKEEAAHYSRYRQEYASLCKAYLEDRIDKDSLNRCGG